MKTILYLGTDPSHYECEGNLVHYPVIKIVPRSLEQQAYAEIGKFTHVIFTSKNAVKVLFEHITPDSVAGKTLIAIGTVTAAHLCQLNLFPQFISPEETQEGIVQLLKTMPLENPYFFLPRSSLSRPVLVNYFAERGIRFLACDLYDTVTQILEPKPDLSSVDEIVFSSPSTVHAFIEIFGALPKGKKLIAIGPVTERALNTLMKKTDFTYSFL
jgi:uroporphyrinogen-III synthase